MTQTTSHRPYSKPETLWVLAQTWRDVLFAHWRIALPELRKVVPEPLPLDSYEGEGWVSIVAFGIENFRARATPPVPKLSAFPEINFRTYVTIDGRPGVYFFSLDVTSRLSVFGGRAFFHLPYYRARMTMRNVRESIQFSSERLDTHRPANFNAEYHASGNPAAPMPGTLDYWLTERYCLYSVDQSRRVYRAEIDHPAWQLQAASAMIQTNTLALASGVELPDVAPLLHYSQRQDATFWFPSRL